MHKWSSDPVRGLNEGGPRGGLTTVVYLQHDGIVMEAQSGRTLDLARWKSQHPDWRYRPFRHAVVPGDFPCVLFLDIDGVLNHGSGGLDAQCVQSLNTILDLTGAEVVIHSSRRYTSTLDDLRALLVAHGFVNPDLVVDTTPCPKVKEHKSGIVIIEDSDFAAFTRGLPAVADSERPASIQKWIDAHKPSRFVILDDTESMGVLSPHHVRIVTQRGLQAQDVIRVLQILKGQD